MGTAGWILIVAAIVVVIVLAVLWIGVRRRRLRSQFGPEYDRVKQERGPWRADSELAARREHRQKLEIKPLEAGKRERYLHSWRELQASFVDKPYESVAAADRLLTSILDERGYPTNDFEQQSADLSVDYPAIVHNYRGAHAIATKERSANTEELRTAMLHYRSLFVELLGDGDGQVRPEADGSRPEETTRQGVRREAPASRETAK
jgi:hypothetical protein